MTNSQQHISVAPLSVQEVYDSSSVSTATTADDVDTTPIDEDALVRKITWRLIPCIGWLYMLSFLDRVNLAKYVCFASIRGRPVVCDCTRHTFLGHANSL